MQVAFGESTLPQVVVERKGGSLVMRWTVTGVVPELVRVRIWLVVWPEVSWPKLRGELGIRLPVRVTLPEPVP